jgi:hypothetical protein
MFSFLFGCVFTFALIWFLNFIQFELSVSASGKRYIFAFVGMCLKTEDVSPSSSSQDTVMIRPVPRPTLVSVEQPQQLVSAAPPPLNLEFVEQVKLEQSAPVMPQSLQSNVDPWLLPDEEPLKGVPADICAKIESSSKFGAL